MGRKSKEKVRRYYSDEERANTLAALAANGGNVNLTAKQLGIPAKTIENWSKGKAHPDVAKLGEQKKGPLADALEVVAFKIVDLLPEKIPSATLQQAATSLGILVDKMQLLRNKPTEIQGAPDDDLRNLTDEELAKRREETRSRLEAIRRGDGVATAGGGAGGSPGRRKD